VSLDLFNLAEQEGIAIEEWDFAAPVKAIYVPGNPPIIGLDKHLTLAELRTYLAEELGHHFTGSTYCMGPYVCYRDKLNVGIAERRAQIWAATYLLPEQALFRAMRHCRSILELAEEFTVLPELVSLRLELLRRRRETLGQAT
jgi:Zn-dependent peptidase ImmA (M78 family)